MWAITCEYCNKAWLEYKGSVNDDMCLCTCPCCKMQTYVSEEELYGKRSGVDL
jgi:hypothetical protein